MKGFTIVELMVSTLIFAVLAGALYGAADLGLKVYKTDNVLLDLQQEARNGLARIILEAREAKTHTITIVTTNSDILTFNTPNETGIKYYLNGTTLVREFPAGSVQTIAQDVYYLKFTQTGALLKINLRTQRVMSGATYMFPLVEQVRMRNE